MTAEAHPFLVPAGADWPEAKVTANSALLHGYVFGQLMMDNFYKVVDISTAKGESIIEHCGSGNRFRLKLQQIGGTE